MKGTPRQLIFFLGTFLGFGIFSITARAEEAALPPVGFHAETLQQGLNVIGVNVVHAPLITGTLSGVDSVVLSDERTDFGEKLEPAVTYTIEFDQGAWSSIASFEGNTIITEKDLSEMIRNGDRYVIRKVKTVEDLFGSVDATRLRKGSGSNDSDLIWVPDGTGGFTKLYPTTGDGFFLTKGWRSVATANEDQSDFPVHLTKGLLVERQDEEELKLFFAGHIKTTPTDYTVNEGFNYLSRVFPIGSTFGNSRLYREDGSGVLAGINSWQHADIVWRPCCSTPGSFSKLYYAVSEGFLLNDGWFDLELSDETQFSSPLSSGFILEAKSGFPPEGDQRERTWPDTITITPPPFYNDL